MKKRIFAVAALAAVGLGSSAMLAGIADAAPPSVKIRLGSDNPPSPCLGVSVDVLGATVGYRLNGTYTQVIGLGDNPSNKCNLGG
jgi:hypothetical protein